MPILIHPLSLIRIALAPALLTQASHLRRTALRLPEASGPRSGIAESAGSPAESGRYIASSPSGATAASPPLRTPLRMLFVGDSSIAGVGVDVQQQAMPWQAAGLLAHRLGRSVAWRVIARSGADTRDARALVEANPPEPADIVVTGLGVNDVTAQRGTARFIADTEELLRAIASRAGASAFVLTGLPPLHVLPAAPQPLRWYLGQCAARLDRGLQQLCRDRPERRYLSLAWARAADMARDRFHPGEGQHVTWATMVADAVCDLLRLGPVNAMDARA